MLGPDIEGRLLAARAEAAAAAGLDEEAERFFIEALTTLPGRLSPEPLIRLHFLRDDLVKARQAYDEFEFPSESEEQEPIRQLLEALESGRRPSLKTFAGLDEPKSPEMFLYQGLLLNLGSESEKAVPYLQEYLSRGRWGESLASRVQLQLTSPDCAMCRSGKATAHWDSAPVCGTCDGLLTNESWKEQAYLQPTPEQKRLLENVLGENANFAQELFEMNTPKKMQVEVGYAPSIGVSELVRRLDAEATALWLKAEELARQRSRKWVGTGELGISIAGEHFEKFQEGTDDFQQFLKECEAWPEESGAEEVGVSHELTWLMNVANWLSENLPPLESARISTRNLYWALDLKRERPISSAAGTISLLMGDRLGAEQRDYLEGLVAQRPHCLFLRSVLSGRSRYDFRPRTFRQSLEHRLWFINNRPDAYPRSSMYRSPAEDYYQMVKAWSESIRAFADDPYVLATAADAFGLDHKMMILALRCRCTWLEPRSTEWKMRLAVELDYLVDDDCDQVDVARLHLEFMKPYLEESSEAGRAHLLTELSLAMFDVEGQERANDLARQLLEIAEQTSDWNTDNAWHKAHTILGLLAIRERDLQRARVHLLMSAQKGKSPQLRILGPNMRLAKALLEAGEWGVVEEFLELCSEFWDGDELDWWTDQVEDREMPFFEFNLWY